MNHFINFVMKVKQFLYLQKYLYLCQGLMKMKKWYGGLLIMALCVMLFLLYSLNGIPPQKQSTKQSAYSFFNNNSQPNDSIKGSSNVEAASFNAELKRIAKTNKKATFGTCRGA